MGSRRWSSRGVVAGEGSAEADAAFGAEVLPALLDVLGAVRMNW